MRASLSNTCASLACYPRRQLRAIVAEKAYVDGLCCTDHAAAGELARLGLVVATRPGRPGELVPAALTPAGATVRQAHLASVGHG